jgi:hypothetical protein
VDGQGILWPSEIGLGWPGGYFSPSSRESSVNFAAGQSTSPSRPRKTSEQQPGDPRIVAGTPEQVVTSLRTIIRETWPGIMAFWAAAVG